MERAPFDPSDPFDASADALRHAIADVALSVCAAPAFQSLPAERQLACMITGLMTGAMGVMLAFVPRAQHDEFVRVAAGYLPAAQQNAYDIMANAPLAEVQ